MDVIFEGAPPFQLPSPQSAKAYAVDDNVEMVLYAVLPGQGTDPVPMKVQMLAKTAEDLAAHLSRAVVEAESRRRS
jgi:hypothetical protein